MLQVSKTQLNQIVTLIQADLNGTYEIFAYGSRTKQQARPYSDLDLLIKAQERLSIEQLYKIKDAFEFSDLPFRVDIQDWHTLSDSFKKAIQDSLVQIL